MAKRLGRNERRKLREMKAAQREIVRSNLSSPRPVDHMRLTSTTARDKLLEASHTVGFSDPRGGLAKARVERAHVPSQRYVLTDERGETWGGFDNKRQAELQAANLNNGWLSRKLKVVDTKPWLVREK
jgi:hypothetical protein